MVFIFKIEFHFAFSRIWIYLIIDGIHKPLSLCHIRMSMTNVNISQYKYITFTWTSPTNAQLFSQRLHASWILTVYKGVSSIYKCTAHTHSYSRCQIRRFPDFLIWNSPISRSSPRLCVFYFWSGSCMSRSLSCFSSRSKTVGSTSNSATPRCSSQSSTLAIPGCSSRHSLQRRSKYIRQTHPTNTSDR